MPAWLTGNLGTVVITLVLVLIVTGIILLMIKDKKQGKSTCGGNCAHCRMCTGSRSAQICHCQIHSGESRRMFQVCRVISKIKLTKGDRF